MTLAAATVAASGCLHGASSHRGPGDFSGTASWEHALALSREGLRTPGGEGPARTRSYIERSLRNSGVSDVREWVVPLQPTGQAVHLLGVLPGTSSDLLVLVAPYDAPTSDRQGSEDGVRSVSGAALVLELGRALSERPRPFTVWMVFLDAEARPEGVHPSRHRFLGSEHWADDLAASDALGRVRAMFYFDDVADPQHPVARDLRSHGTYRDVFFETAEELGHAREFPRAGHVRSLHGGHRVLLDRDMRRVVAIFGAPRLGEDSSKPTANPSQTLSAIGEVSVESIDRIARQLEKADAFSSPATAAGPQGEKVPQAKSGRP